MVVSIVSILAMLAAFTLWILRTNRGIIYFLFIYAAVFPLIANFILEFGIHITEQGRASYATGSTLRLLGYHAVFFATAFLVQRATARPARREVSNRLHLASQAASAMRPQGLKDLGLYALGFVLVALLINAFLSPLPLLNGEITRFNFWETAKWPFLRVIFGKTSLPIAILLGFYLVYYAMGNNVSRVKTTVFFFILYLVYLYALGEKFTGPFLAAVFFATPYVAYRVSMGLDLGAAIRRHGLKLFIAFLACGYVVLHYYNNYDLSATLGSPWLAILYRAFVLQGHMYWGMDELAFVDRQYGSAFIQMFVSNGWDGMKTAMYAVSPARIADAYLNAGIRFSGGYPGISLLLVGPWLTIAVQLVFGVVVGIWVNYVYKCIMRCRLVVGSAAMMVLFSLFYVYAMGDFTVFYSGKFLFAVGLICVFEILLWTKSEGNTVPIAPHLELRPSENIS